MIRSQPAGLTAFHCSVEDTADPVSLPSLRLRDDTLKSATQLLSLPSEPFFDLTPFFDTRKDGVSERIEIRLCGWRKLRLVPVDGQREQRGR